MADVFETAHRQVKEQTTGSRDLVLEATDE